MAKPTEEAETHFVLAQRTFGHIIGSSGDIPKLALGLANMALGLEKLSVGLRATYVELQEVKRLLQTQRL